MRTLDRPLTRAYTGTMLKLLEQRVREWLAQEKEEYVIGRVKPWEERTQDLYTEIELRDGTVDYSQQVGFVRFTLGDGTRRIREFTGIIPVSQLLSSNDLDVYIHTWTGDGLGYVVLRVRDCAISPIDLII